jgi:hypothetical protein
MNNLNKIDELFREAMTGYKETPSLGLWLRIERRFFPPSKFRPSGLITSVMLLMVAGLMPWILIPANVQDDKQPNLPENGNYKRGYLIQAASHEDIRRSGNNITELSGRTFTIKPTVYLDNPVNPAISPSEQFIASIIDPAEDPAIQPLLQAYQEEYDMTADHETAATAFSAVHWIYRMRSYSAGILNQNIFNEEISTQSTNIPKSAFSPSYENDYFKNGELSIGLNFNPSIIFYDPNPYNKMLGGEAVFHYKISSFSIMSGLGFSRAEDVGSYTVNYITNDSVGYYLRVVSFIPDPRNPGNIEYVVIQEPIYDSVPHYTIADKTNYYSYIDIPLSFGYTFFQKNRVSLTVSAGLKFSFLVAKDEPQVDFWISDAELVDIEREIPARTNTNWRFTAGVDFGYLFTRNFSLHFEPVFEQYISPIYVEQPGYEPKKPYVTGIKAGIRYNF